MVSDVKQGKGAIGTLLKDTAMTGDLKTFMKELTKSSERVSAMTLELDTMANKMNNGNGTIATLVNDTAMAESLCKANYDQSLQSASKKLDEDLEAMKA